METNWSGLDTQALQTLYETKLAALNAALLGGGAWEDLRETRHEVTQLSILLSKRQAAHPAEFNSRQDE